MNITTLVINKVLSCLWSVAIWIKRKNIPIKIDAMLPDGHRFFPDCIHKYHNPLFNMKSKIEYIED